ncbi:urea transporter [Pedobacter sp. AW1-32]|uniref:urea transporter n=1 Tax=Pedobacter sp. AW1-32 TaxID=3383026 RepID=UPI003FF0DE56
MKKTIKYYTLATLNSYAILFFSQNKVFGVLLLIVSFFSPVAGIAGLVSVLSSLILLTTLGFCREEIKAGLFSFNALLLGIGFGTFFNLNAAFWLWLFTAILLCVVISVNLHTLLSKYALPTLSIPFVFTFWIALIAVNGYAGMGLMQKSSYVIFELTTRNTQFIDGADYFLSAHGLKYLSLFFRSVSAVLFQDNVLAGLLISVGFFIHSRIGFSLLVIGFVCACMLNHIIGIYPEGISNYHLGANFMMVSCAIGGFFLVPSWRSYAWAIATVPFTFLLVNGISRFLGIYNLPVFSLPFCIATIGLLYFFMLRKSTGTLTLTSFQNYAPEVNLYQHHNGQERLKEFRYINLTLPFMGTWDVSQGYGGEITHRGEWNQALDFLLKDLDGKTYSDEGIKPENYYCFAKPVLAVADGYVEEVITHVEDNAIGQVNLKENWGNTIIIKHSDGLYSKVSHLKKNSAKVKTGDYVHQGDIIGLCGNSGRSPEPHIHFQLQATPYVGSKTLAYPFAYFVCVDTNQLQSFTIPKENQRIQMPEINPYLKNAFHFLPGYIAEISDGESKRETWEVRTDEFNSTYFYCHENQSIAYFVNNGTVFYFTRFYGSKKSFLFKFYKAAYKIVFSGHSVEDVYAIDGGDFKPGLWLQDLLSPFYIFTKNRYHNQIKGINNGAKIYMESSVSIFNRQKTSLQAEINITDSGITGFDILSDKLSFTWQSVLT